MRTAVGVDLGGTKIAAGIVDLEGKILNRAELPSDIDDPNGIRDQIADLVDTLAPTNALGLGIGAAGIVNFATGYYLFGPNTGLRDVELARVVEDKVDLPVRLDNDANCAAWAEYRFGVGRGTRDFICVTLGTGIGGGFVLDGRPYRGAHGAAAEIGHMIVDPNGPICGCGRPGCWEQFASGLALERSARDGLAAHPESALSSQVVNGRISGRAITEAARDGDAFALGLVEQMARWIGWGFGSLVNIIEPERIAVAGGIVREWDFLGPLALAAMRERIEAGARRPEPEVLPATLGPDAGIVGAAWLILGGLD
ncbi:MAG: ROK family protein [Actinomycetota bacterium]